MKRKLIKTLIALSMTTTVTTNFMTPVIYAQEISDNEVTIEDSNNNLNDETKEDEIIEEVDKTEEKDIEDTNKKEEIKKELNEEVKSQLKDQVEEKKEEKKEELEKEELEKEDVKTAKKEKTSECIPIGEWKDNYELMEEVCSKTGVDNIEDVTYDDIKEVKMLDVWIDYEQEFPEIIGEFEGLVILNLPGSSLTEFPECITKLSNLKELNISSTNISNLPKSMAKLSNLEALFMSYTQIENIPEVVFELSNLKILELYGNSISNLSGKIANLKKLEILELGGTYIDSLPSELYSMDSLRYLGLSNTYLNEIPKGIFNMTKLEDLAVRGNNLIEIPDEIINMKGYKVPFTIDASMNQIVNLPETNGQKIIKDCNFVSNKVFGIELGNQLVVKSKTTINVNKGETISPEELRTVAKCMVNIDGEVRYSCEIDPRHEFEFIIDGEVFSEEDIKNLEEGVYYPKLKLKNASLDNKCAITKDVITLKIGNGEEDPDKKPSVEKPNIPDDATGRIPIEYWEDCSTLMYQVCIYLHAKNIEDVTFEDIATIESLYLENLGTDNFPTIIKSFKNLKKLYIGSNDLVEIPKEVYSLKNLEMLDISWNEGITKLPKELSSLKKLKEIDAFYCNISQIDKEVSKMNLENLYLDSNEEIYKILDDIYKIKSLKELSLCGCKLGKIDKKISNLVNLEYLNLSDNQLTSVPKLDNVQIVSYYNVMPSDYEWIEPKQIVINSDIINEGIEINQGEVLKQDYLRSLLCCVSEYNIEEISSQHEVDFVIDGKIVSAKELSKFKPGTYEVNLKLASADLNNVFARAWDPIKVVIKEKKINNNTGKTDNKVNKESIKQVGSSTVNKNNTINNDKKLPYTGGVSSMASIIFGSGLIGIGAMLGKKKRK